MKLYNEQTNQYIRLDRLKSYDEIIELISTNSLTFIHSNQTISLLELTNKLIEHDRRNKKVLYISLDIMLPLQSIRSKKTRIKFVEEFMKLNKQIAKLPYFAFIHKRGKANYLYIIICERMYYPEGVFEKCVCKHDIYRNKKGQLCKATDEGAILTETAGSSKSEKLVYFSKKKSYFRFPTLQLKKKYIDDLKLKSLIALKNCGVKITNEIILKRYSHDTCKAKWAHKNIKLANKYIKNIEYELNNFYSGLLLSAAIKTNKQDFDDLYKSLTTSLKNKSYKVRRNIVLNLSPEQSTKNMINAFDSFEYHVKEKIKQTSKTIYGNIKID